MSTEPPHTSIQVEEKGGPYYATPDRFNKAQDFKDIVVLFYASEMKELAEEISTRSGGRIVLGSVSLNRFPDSFPDIFISRAEILKWANVAFLASFHLPDVIFEQMSFLWALPKYFVKSLKIILPFFPTGTHERVIRYGEVATAKTLAKMLSMTPSTKCGSSEIAIFDIHTLQNQFYFDDNLIPSLHTAAPLLKRELQRLTLCNNENVCIVYPDDGAFKRFSMYYKEYPSVICAKSRENEKRVVRVREGSCAGMHAVVIDDIVHSGGTLVESIKACWHNGAAKVSCFVTHAVFENDAWKRFTTDELKLSTFYVTNTHPTSKVLKLLSPFKVLSIAPLVESILLEEEPYSPESPIAANM